MFVSGATMDTEGDFVNYVRRIELIPQQVILGFLTHHAVILLSDPGWDISILNPYCACYPTLPNYFHDDNNNNKGQLNKLPQSTIIIRLIDGTIRFNKAKIQTHALGSICIRRDGI